MTASWVRIALTFLIQGPKNLLARKATLSLIYLGARGWPVSVLTPPDISGAAGNPHFGDVSLPLASVPELDDFLGQVMLRSPGSWGRSLQRYGCVIASKTGHGTSIVLTVPIPS